ncbi:TPA: hypothetical protein ACX6SK_002417 [Photobacterium damselae]
MPNHILNIIEIETEDKQQQDQSILSVLNGQGEFDFNRFIPMPAILRNTQSPNLLNPDECRKKTGYTDWYNWSNDLWGTKWNAYNQKLNYELLDFKPWHLSHRPKDFFMDPKIRAYVKRQNKKRFKRSIKENQAPESIVFFTAWGHPEKIMLAMSKKYPDIYFKIRFADEDLGRNCGVYILKDGKLFDIKLDIANEEAALNYAEAVNLWAEFYDFMNKI